MRRGSWLGLVVCVAAGSPGAAQVPVVADDPPGAFADPDHPPLRDLTPDGFADIVPPPPPHAGHDCPPGHLAPTAPGHAGFYGTAEYLLFRPRSGAFDFALVNGGTGLATTGPVESLKYDLGNGVRAELGYRFERGWEVGFAYTFLEASGGRTLTAAAGQVLFPTLTRPGLTDTVTSAAASASLSYNLYDGLIGKRFTVHENFAVRAFGGFRFADITQRFNVGYNGLDAVNAAVNTRSAFEGFGPMIGGEAVLGGWCGLHAYARASGGLLNGRSTNSIRETNNAGGTVYADSRYDVRKVVPVAGLAIGGGWQYRTVSIRAGYEVTHFFGLTEPLRFVDDVGQGKLVTRPSYLSLEGFFVQVGFTF
jgi:hypothetical protein